MICLKEIQCPASTCSNLGESKMNKSTRPEEQPRHTVDRDTAEIFGRYSGGNNSRFSEFHLMDVPSELMLYPSNCGGSGSVLVGTLSETEDKQKVPISVSRYDLVLLNDFTVTTVPTLKVCRHLPLLAFHTLTVRSQETEARSLESWEKVTERTIALWPSRV